MVGPPSVPSLRRVCRPHGVPGLQQRLSWHAWGRVPQELPHAGRGLCELAWRAQPRCCPKGVPTPAWVTCNGQCPLPGYSRAIAGDELLTSACMSTVQHSLRVWLCLPPGARVGWKWGLRGRGRLPLSAQRGRLQAWGHHQGRLQHLVGPGSLQGRALQRGGGGGERDHRDSGLSRPWPGGRRGAEARLCPHPWEAPLSPIHSLENTPGAGARQSCHQGHRC